FHKLLSLSEAIVYVFTLFAIFFLNLEKLSLSFTLRRSENQQYQNHKANGKKLQPSFPLKPLKNSTTTGTSSVSTSQGSTGTFPPTTFLPALSTLSRARSRR
ncbi:MAG: hypothetical protein LBI47_03190, partial [Puniceicoccales bacterium]|nr:hypothetical protein [Puniceicoccales bacterium]